MAHDKEEMSQCAIAGSKSHVAVSMLVELANPKHT